MPPAYAENPSIPMSFGCLEASLREEGGCMDDEVVEGEDSEPVPPRGRRGGPATPRTLQGEDSEPVPPRGRRGERPLLPLRGDRLRISPPHELEGRVGKGRRKERSGEGAGEGAERKRRRRSERKRRRRMARVGMGSQSSVSGRSILDRHFGGQELAGLAQMSRRSAESTMAAFTATLRLKTAQCVSLSADETAFRPANSPFDSGFPVPFCASACATIRAERLLPTRGDLEKSSPQALEHCPGRVLYGSRIDS